MAQEREANVREGDPRYTWDDAVAAIGKDIGEGDEVLADETIEYTTVVRFCEVWEIGNPIYWYEDVAKQAGYQGVAVPWSAIKQTFAYGGFWRPGQPTRFPLSLGRDASGGLGRFAPRGQLPIPPTSQGLFTDLEVEFFAPVCVGDRLTQRGDKIVNVRPRKTRIGFGAFMNREHYIYNQRGELVARVNEGLFRYNRE